MILKIGSPVKSIRSADRSWIWQTLIVFFNWPISQCIRLRCELYWAWDFLSRSLVWVEKLPRSLLSNHALTSISSISTTGRACHDQKGRSEDGCSTASRNYIAGQNTWPELLLPASLQLIIQLKLLLRYFKPEFQFRSGNSTKWCPSFRHLWRKNRRNSCVSSDFSKADSLSFSKSESRGPLQSSINASICDCSVTRSSSTIMNCNILGQSGIRSRFG
jgi:hypothetical protein